MLPPVRAPSSVSPDYQTQAPQIVARPRLDLQSAHLHAAANDMPVSGGRLDILSLSGQLQIAQGSSIFAETIGALLDMPRGENEPLTDYAKRLTEAVKAMSPGERAVLERMLNQLVKGVSVRLLAEILNNPAGLEAAKLAMSIEGAQLAGTDQATSAVVSSYRQNGGDAASGGAAAAPSRNPAAPTGGQPTAPAQTQTATAAPGSAVLTASSAATQQAQATSHSADEGGAANAGLPEAIEFGGEALPEGSEQHANAASRSSAVSGRPIPAGQTGDAGGPRAAGPAADNHDAGHANGPASVGMAKTAGDGLATAVQTSISGRLAQAAAAQAPGVPSEAAKVRGQETPAASKSENGGAVIGLLKHPDTERHAGPDSVRMSRAANEPMPAALAAWLAEAFATDLSDASTLSSLLARAPETSLDEVLRRLFGRSTPAAQAEAAQTATPEHANQTGAAARAEAASAEAATAEEPHPPAAANPKMANGDAADAPDARFVPVLPLPVIRETVVPVFVPYPPTEEEEEREERKAKQVDAIGEEMDEDAPEDQSFHHHDDEDDGTEGEDEEANQDKVPDEENARANDLYWRMAGWN